MDRRHNFVFRNILLGIAIVIVSLSLTFILLYIFAPFCHSSVAVEPAKKTAVQKEARIAKASAPVRLAIAKVATDAIVNPVGLNDAGDMDIDDNPTQLAWYEPGAKPGEEGSAVIAGHYGWKDGVSSVFNDINKLVKGDEITTYDVNGMKKTFVVTRTALYDPNQDATNVFKSDDGKAHLNLITCQGSWIKADSTYSERLVVFTDLLKQ